MKCRSLSKNNSIIWFGKDLLEPASYSFYRLDATGKSGYLDKIVTDGEVITIDGIAYTVSISGIVGVLLNNDEVAGVVSLSAAKTPLDNYSTDSAAVADSLTQRLSVIKGELWYQVNFGLPLADKQRSTNIFDFIICDIITSHPGVASLDKYTSKTDGHTYTYTCEITSVYGDSLTISNNLTT